MGDLAELRELAVDSIFSNPENPRYIFRPTIDARLAESIETSGVLVPVYVYPDGDRFILIDGERRWRQAKRLGLETMPALVRAGEPDRAANIVEMFNIHLVRAQWEDMPTARALEKVMERTGTTDPAELKRMTGLSMEKIKDFQLILGLPQEFQDQIWSGEPMNFFVEFEESVIRPLARHRPGLAEKYAPDDLRRAFLRKREVGSLPDVVELRKMRDIIRRAGDDAGAPEESSDIDNVIEHLISEPRAKIQDAHTEVALAHVEIENFARITRSLISAVERMIRTSADDPEIQQRVRAAIGDTIASLQSRLDGMPSQ